MSQAYHVIDPTDSHVKDVRHIPGEFLSSTRLSSYLHALSVELRHCIHDDVDLNDTMLLEDLGMCQVFALTMRRC